jgi:hypothetical protein
MFDGAQEGLRIDRLLQDDAAWRRSRVVKRRDEHHRDHASLALQTFIQLEAAHARKIDVDDRAIGRTDVRQPRLRRVEDPYGVAARTQQSGERTPDVIVILDYDEGGAPIGHAWPGPYPGMSWNEATGYPQNRQTPNLRNGKGGLT